MQELEDIVRMEIEDLHAFFVDWFSGSASEAAFEARFTDHMDPDMVLIPPGGNLMALEDLSAGLRKGYGTNPDFRIAIRNVKLQRILDHHFVVTYEEWQRNALASTPPDNGRIATVLFTRSAQLKWLHIHETWLPSAVMESGPYNF
ncbi:MAG: hypothetical protein ABJN26_08795 [Stappiaceae bacterium]